MECTGKEIYRNCHRQTESEKGRASEHGRFQRRLYKTGISESAHAELIGMTVENLLEPNYQKETENPSNQQAF